MDDLFDQLDQEFEELIEDEVANRAPGCGLYIILSDFSDVEKLKLQLAQALHAANRFSTYAINRHVVEYRPSGTPSYDDARAFCELSQRNGFIFLVSDDASLRGKSVRMACYVLRSRNVPMHEKLWMRIKSSVCARRAVPLPNPRCLWNLILSVCILRIKATVCWICSTGGRHLPKHRSPSKVLSIRKIVRLMLPPAPPSLMPPIISGPIRQKIRCKGLSICSTGSNVMATK